MQLKRGDSITWMSPGPNPPNIFSYKTIMNRPVHRIFTTITFKDGAYESRVEQETLNEIGKISDNYCAVKELGSYGTNPHLHIYAELKQPKRTDKVTDRIKKVYKKLGIYTNRRTIRTLKETDPIYRIGYYFQKEEKHEIIFQKGINFQNFKEKYIARQSLSEKLIKKPNYKTYTVNELPTVYFAYCDSNKLDRNDIYSNVASMIRDDIIQVNQFRSLRSVKLKILIKLDRGEAESCLRSFMDEN